MNQSISTKCLTLFKQLCELGIQLEEPFSVLPQHKITNGSIGLVLSEAVDLRKTDFERMLDA